MRPLLLDDQPRAGDPRGVAFADRQRMAGIGLVAAGDHDRRRRYPRQLLDRSNGRERGTTSSASATAAGCSCAASRWRSARSVTSRHCAGSARGHRRPRTPPPRPRAAPAPARPSARASGSRTPAGVEGRRDQPQREHALGVAQGEAQDRVRAHRGARQDRALDAQRRRAPAPGRARGARSRRRRASGAGVDAPCPRAS